MFLIMAHGVRGGEVQRAEAAARHQGSSQRET